MSHDAGIGVFSWRQFPPPRSVDWRAFTAEGGEMDMFHDRVKPGCRVRIRGCEGVILKRQDCPSPAHILIRFDHGLGMSFHWCFHVEYFCEHGWMSYDEMMLYDN